VVFKRFTTNALPCNKVAETLRSKNLLFFHGGDKARS